MILYNSENNISKPIPNKSFSRLKLSHCLRYKAIVVHCFVIATIMFKVYFMSHVVAKPLSDLTTKYYCN